MEKITAIVPARKGSQRVPNKNFKPFFKNKSLLEIKIESLLEVKNIDEIIVNTNSQEGIDIAKYYNVSYHNREAYYASSICKGSEFFKNIAEHADDGLILYVPCTSPFIKLSTYYSIINQYYLTKDHDSINTVANVKEFLWLNNSPLNYIPKDAPNSQDLPNVQRLTFGCNIISKSNMIKNRNIIGENPSFFVVEEIEAIDIDTILDFEISQYLYGKMYE